jgi:hypothetical protein
VNFAAITLCVYCCCLFRYRLSPETFGYTSVCGTVAHYISSVTIYITLYFTIFCIIKCFASLVLPFPLQCLYTEYEVHIMKIFLCKKFREAYDTAYVTVQRAKSKRYSSNILQSLHTVCNFIQILIIKFQIFLTERNSLRSKTKGYGDKTH